MMEENAVDPPKENAVVWFSKAVYNWIKVVLNPKNWLQVANPKYQLENPKVGIAWTLSSIVTLAQITLGKMFATLGIKGTALAILSGLKMVAIKVAKVFVTGILVLLDWCINPA